MKKWLRRLSRIELVMIFLVIIAGSIVRMTGSGMGCPDWPKCFGYLIPPTDKAQLEWQPDRKFQKGKIIIRQKSLKVANGNFTTGADFSPQNWNNYTKHDYALFNPFHTWTEYINRLVGALSGIPMALLFFLSLLYVRKDWQPFALSAAGLFMLGFEAWLGKLVVDGNLIPGSITIHMMGALLIVALMLVLNGLLSRKEHTQLYYTKLFRNGMIISLIFILIQIILGTQVREEIDTLNQAGIARASWIDNLEWMFYIHRSFSIALLALAGWLYWYNRKYRLGFTEMPWLMALVIGEMIIGIVLAYLEVPKWAQPVHLLLGTALFAVQLQVLLRYYLTQSLQRLVAVH